MRRIALAAAVVAALLAPPVALADYSARVSGLPTVQSIGRAYPFVITVRNKGAWVKFFCIDFNDDDNSWLIRGPATMAKYPKSDGFCTSVLKKGTRNFRFVLIPARQGAHTLEVILGKGGCTRRSRRFSSTMTMACNGRTSSCSGDTRRL